MNGYHLSLNQFAEYSGATVRGKVRIIKQQLNPNPFLIPWYQLSKARIRKSLELGGDLKPIYEGIEILLKRKPDNKRKQNDRQVSLESMQRFIEIKLPEILSKIDYEVIKPEKKTLNIGGVGIIVAPDLVIRGKLSERMVLGGIKIHISKNKPFDFRQSQFVAAIIKRYLEEEVAVNGDVVLPELCFSLDVFGERIVPAPSKAHIINHEIETICLSIIENWDEAS